MTRGRPHSLEQLRHVLDGKGTRSPHEDELRALISAGAVIRSSAATLNLPASQLADTFRVRHDIEAKRRVAGNEPSWFGLEELVLALDALRDERLFSLSVETTTREYVAFFTDSICVAVICHVLR